MATRKNQMHAYAEPDEKAKLVRMAKELRMSESDVLRMLVRRYKEGKLPTEY